MSTPRPQRTGANNPTQESGNLFDADMSTLDPQIDQWLDEYWEDEAERQSGQADDASENEATEGE